MSGNKQLDRAWKAAENLDREIPLAELRGWCASMDEDQRLLALLAMRRQLDGEAPEPAYFDLARGMVADDNNNCRWQALIVIGEFIPTRPDDVWSVIREHGESEDEDMRSGIACVLLEHLLQQHGERFWPEVNDLAAQSEVFGETLMLAGPQIVSP